MTAVLEANADTTMKHDMHAHWHGIISLKPKLQEVPKSILLEVGTVMPLSPAWVSALALEIQVTVFQCATCVQVAP